MIDVNDINDEIGLCNNVYSFFPPYNIGVSLSHLKSVLLRLQQHFSDFFIVHYILN